MLDKTIIEKILESVPLAIFIIGTILFVIAAVGGIPIGTPPLQITDPLWKLALGIMGFIMVCVGLLFVVRERKIFVSENQKKNDSKDSDSLKNIHLVQKSQQHDTGELFNEVETEICFLGIIAKRTVNSDAFKRFLTSKRNTSVNIKFLLLDPDSQVFLQRAHDENESVTAWKQDLYSTIERLQHYKQEYNISIEVRLYNIYPIWRIIVINKRKIVMNFFLKGKRGTESDQIVMTDINNDWAQAYIEYVELLWNHHSKGG